MGDKLKAAGLTLTGSGVVNLPKDEAKCRKAFENVKAAGMQTMVCKPDLDALPLVEKLVKEFDPLSSWAVLARGLTLLALLATLMWPAREPEPARSRSPAPSPGRT